MTASHTVDTVVLDVDGTLVDSVYVHVSAWMRAFRGVGVPVEGWRIHRAIGMGGDRLVAAVAGQKVEDAVGDQARELHDQEYDDLVAGVLPLPGADDLLETLKQRGFTVVLASSGTKTQTEQALQLLERSDLADAWVCSADVDSSKPAPGPRPDRARARRGRDRRDGRRRGVGRRGGTTRGSRRHRAALWRVR